MTVTDQIKILDRKIVQNEAQYDLDRKVAKISALPSNNLDKYEYLTYEDLGLKLSTVEQANFEYSPVGKIFNKGLDKDKDKKEGLLKRLKNIEDKNEEQLKVLKDQLEKQPIIRKVKNPNFNNVSFRTFSDTKSMKVFNEIRDEDEIIDYSRLNSITSSKKYTFKFEDFTSLGNLAENIYNGKVSLDIAKQEQRKMENILKGFIDYNPIKDVYKNQKTNILLNAREFYTGRKEVLIPFEENMFPLPKQYVFGENEWKERDLSNEKLMPKTFKLSFLEKYDHTPLSEKENELLDRDIDELVDAFNNTKTSEELDELFNKISNKSSTLKKLVKIVPNITEKKRIDNVIKGVEFTLDYAASLGYIYSDSKLDSPDSDFSNPKGSALKILTPNQMLSRLPISLAQLKAGNNSEKLKNNIRQLLYSLYKSKKPTKQFYQSLIDII